MPFISVDKLWKTYASHVVLEKISIDVEQGEFCALVGASGCGKSTFLKILLGTESITRGSVTLDGKPLGDEPDQDRGIVFQRYSVFPHLTVLQNVLLGIEIDQSKVFGRLFGKSKQRALEQAQMMIDAVGLAPAVNRYPSELSGGMQQRLALAQSLIKKPRVLLLDEPFGALDPGIRADMHVLVKGLWRELNITVFMVTHDIKEGFELGTRLMVFDKTRHDPQAPEAYGASITYDIPLKKSSAAPMLEKITESIEASEMKYQQSLEG